MTQQPLRKLQRKQRNIQQNTNDNLQTKTYRNQSENVTSNRKGINKITVVAVIIRVKIFFYIFVIGLLLSPPIFYSVHCLRLFVKKYS